LKSAIFDHFKKLMKKLFLMIPLLATCAVKAETWNSGFSNSGNIPDGNLSGWSDSRTIAGYSSGGGYNLSVTLQLSGGFDGDLYAYLSHGTGFVILFNRMGVGTASPLNALGSPASGMNVTFSDGASNGDIHLYTGTTQLSGPWQADGRDLSPISSPSLFQGAARENGGNPLGSFSGLDPNGDWTLFVADVSSGGGTAQITSWGLALTPQPVPEPSVLSLAGMGAGTLLLSVIRRRK
jgi:hypothetical protein